MVEDEPVIRDLIVEVLQDLGYRALEAADGPSGLEGPAIEEAHRPARYGCRAARAQRTPARRPGPRATRPDLKVLFITGYAENATIANGFLDPGMEMITKPFAVEALASKIRSMIRGR